jgi:hypothetical protein
MPLLPQEVSPGAVAYFDVGILNAATAILKPANPTTRNGPFLCLQVVGESSSWTALTWTGRPERLFIEKAWREGGTTAWQNGTPYVNDGAITYRGPNASFIAAAAVADTYRPETRQRVSTAGVAAAVAEVTHRAGGLL